MRGKGVRIGDGVPRSDGENLKIEKEEKKKRKECEKRGGGGSWQ